MSRIVRTLALAATVILAIALFTTSGQAEPATPYKVYIPLVLRQATFSVTPTPTPTPSSTPTACNKSLQVLVNPGFEEGWNGWTPDQWASSNPIITGPGYQSAYALGLGGYNGSYDFVSQYFTVPSWAEAGALHFRWKMISDDANTGTDCLTVGVGQDWGPNLALHHVFNTYQQGVWTYVSVPLTDVTSYRGSELRCSLAGTTSASLPTGWFVDDVTVVFSCGSVQP